MSKTPKRQSIWRFLPIAFLFVSLGFRFGLSRWSDENAFVYYFVQFGFIGFLILGLIAASLTWRSWRWWLVAIPGSALCWYAPVVGAGPRAGKPDLVVMTYNIAHCEINEAGVFDILEKSNADVLFLQEASIRADVDALESKLRKTFPGCNIARSTFNMIVSPELPLRLEAEIDVPSKWNDKKFPEAILTVGDRRIRVISAHLEPSWMKYDAKFLDSVKYLATVAENRKKQCDLIRARIQQSREPVIVAGDFNGTPFSQIPRLLSADLTDCMGQVGPVWTSNTLSSVYPYKRIDMVFTSKSIAPLTGEVLKDFSSDHRPVKVSLKLP